MCLSVCTCRHTHTIILHLDCSQPVISPPTPTVYSLHRSQSDSLKTESQNMSFLCSEARALTVVYKPFSLSSSPTTLLLAVPQTHQEPLSLLPAIQGSLSAPRSALRSLPDDPLITWLFAFSRSAGEISPLSVKTQSHNTV